MAAFLEAEGGAEAMREAVSRKTKGLSDREIKEICSIITKK